MHTKGPWKTGKERRGFVLHNKHAGIYAEEGSSLLLIAETVNGLDKGEADANARLIASAPRMFDMLKDAATMLVTLTGENLAVYARTFSALASEEIRKAEGR